MKLSFLFLSICILFSCKSKLDGIVKANAAPETYTVVDTIIRHGTNSFNSQVEISWWSNDPDGFVNGYEFTFDSIITSNTVWNFTKKQDSIFLLSTPPGHDTVRFQFYVRAIDNLGLKDLTPAHLSYPVKNSPPTVSFLPGANNPLKTFPVLKFYFEGSDPDGFANLNRFEICMNDSTNTPYPIAVSATSFTIEANNFLSNTPLSSVYLNSSLVALPNPINGLILNDTNKIFIRAVDNADAKSNWVSSYSLYVKKPTSTILLVDGYPTNGAAVENFYATNLIANSFPVFDTMQIFQQAGGHYTQLAPDNLTQSRIFKLFNTIIWFSNDAYNSLSIGQRTLNDFFNNNGKMLMAVYISTSFDPQSTFLDFTPIASLEIPNDTTLLLADTSTVFAMQSGYSSLKSNFYISTVRPFNLVNGATKLYDGNLIAKDNITLSLSPWTGISTVIAKKQNGTGQTNFVISTLELQKLDGNANISAFFNKILHNEFGL